MTPPSPRGSVLGDGRGLSARPAGTGTALLRRGGVPGLSVRLAMAAGLCLSGLRRSGTGHPARALALRKVRSGNLGDGRYDLPRHQTGVDDLVSGDVACDLAEERHQRAGPAAGARFGQLQNRLDAASQVATGDGAAWARAFARRGGGGRSLLGRGRIWG